MGWDRKVLLGYVFPTLAEAVGDGTGVLMEVSGSKSADFPDGAASVVDMRNSGIAGARLLALRTSVTCRPT
jgi:hypothetical protein